MIWLAANWRMVIVGLLAAALAIAVVWASWQRADIVSLRAQRDQLQATVEAYKEATKLRRADDMRRAEISAGADQFDQNMAKEEGGDAPLGHYLATGARKLWP
ncbi:hypothetical protein BMG03_01130 [Thioclava nitratireducens]|uniref:Uncharacterized protein n=1 Tax=Thioclava nitratireducens TaxID=1915078 RepID=A0ABN4X909_9RHOB|nr:hypothetical protein [Thioclava nitratireducens]AQS46559.1 hypothetical protein BMG03_01130 [Thioclava nitratireducens]